MAIGNTAAYHAEYTPATVRNVGQVVVDHFQPLTWAHIGFKGDDAHWGGYHRSLRWCTATYGSGVDYSDRLGRDTSQRGTKRADAIRAIDISAPDGILLPMCQRVDRAMRAGLLDDVREWYGNRDGDSRVDGYDNFYNAVVSSDASHLWHLHLSLYTDTVDAPHTRLTAVLLGTPGWDEEDDMPLTADDVNKVATAVWERDLPSKELKKSYRANGWLKRADIALTEILTVKKEQSAARLRDEAILAAVQGVDTAGVLARVDALATEITAHAEEDRARDLRLMELIEQAKSGQLDAVEVVRQIGELLTAAAADTGDESAGSEAGPA